MQRRFQSRTLASWLASFAAHVAVLALLSFAITTERGGRVSVLEVQVVSDPAETKRPSLGPRGGTTSPVRSEEKAVAPAVQPVGDPSRRASYIQSLREAIEAVKAYPPLARARKQEGRVEVAFTLRKDGGITEIAV